MSGRKKIVLAGGSGSIGRFLRHQLKQEYEIVVLSRADREGSVKWDGRTLGNWKEQLEGALAVINLSGASIENRHTPRYKDQILRSRVESTRVLCEAIGQLNNPVAKWINASGIGIYGNDDVVKDESGTFGDDFVTDVCKRWESEIRTCSCDQTEKYILRIAPVLMRNSGLLKPLIATTRMGLGGTIGSGKNFMSWIHVYDVYVVIKACLTNELPSGNINVVAPHVIPNKEFMSSLRKTWNVPFGLPAPKFAVKVGALLQGKEPSLIFSNQRIKSSVIPREMFHFPDLPSALQNLRGKT